jgi:hypothetical protein
MTGTEHEFRLARLREFKKSFPPEGMWRDYQGKARFAKEINGRLRMWLDPRISPKRAALENPSSEAISQRGLPLKAHDSFGMLEVKPSAKSEPGREVEPEREKAWFDKKLVEDRVEKLFQATEFYEIRSRLGSALAAQFIRLLALGLGEDAEKHLRSCGLRPSDVMHLMRVANEA